MPQGAAGRERLYGLVCAGGGAHGAYQVGVLKYVHEHFCNGDASPFKVFSGTSAGSLNTAFSAAQSYDARSSRLWLEELWRNFHVPQYHGNIVKNSILTLLKEWAKPKKLRQHPWSLLDPTPLRDVVDRGFLRPNFNRAIREGTTVGLSVSATELKTSRMVWFQEGPAATSWISADSIAIETDLGTPHVQASCSVPLAFPPVVIGEHYYADGGVANKRPFTPAINMGATRILSIATDQPLPIHLPTYAEGFKPHVGETIKMLLDQLSFDSAPNQRNMIEALNYFREQTPVEDRHASSPNVFRGDTVDLSRYDPVEVMLFAPSRRIRSSDIFHSDLFDEALEDRSTSLLFHREFTGNLIDFGYDDARARHDELQEFFERDRPQKPSTFDRTPEPGDGRAG